MKNYLMMLSLLLVVPLRAQQSESKVPAVLPSEAADFFLTFQKAVTYMADKNVPARARKDYAKTFVANFAETAIIQVQNGTKTENLKPLDYFNRLIDLKYEQVKINITIDKTMPFQKDTQGWWKTDYIFGQWFWAKRQGKVIKDYTIKKIGLYFLYTASTNSWTKKYGHITVEYNQRFN